MSIPLWLSSQLDIVLEVSDFPEFLRKSYVSDHVATTVFVKSRKAVPFDRQVVSPAVAGHLSFKQTMDKYFHFFQTVKVPIVDKWMAHKEFIKEVSAITRNSILATAPSSRLSLLLSICTLARAFWRQDVKFAAGVLLNFKCAHGFLKIPDKEVIITDYNIIEDLYGATRFTELNDEIAEIESELIDANAPSEKTRKRRDVLVEKCVRFAKVNKKVDAVATVVRRKMASRFLPSMQLPQL